MTRWAMTRWMALGLVGLLAIGGCWVGARIVAEHAAGSATQSSVPPTVSPSGRTAIPVSGAVHDRIATLPLGSTGQGYFTTPPAWLTYDDQTGAFYVAGPGSNVSIVTNASGFQFDLNGTVPVGTAPFDIAYDNLSGDLFVTNSGSDNVSVLHATDRLPIASIGVGTDPMGIAFDPFNGLVYVANAGSDNVTVLSPAPLRVVANLSVGQGPVGVAADPVTGDVYVADNRSDEVTVISGTTDHVIANVAVGSGPIGVAVDNVTDVVYVTNEGSGNVSAISGSNDTVIASIAVADPLVTLQGVVFDWEDGLVWIGGGRSAIVVIDPVTEQVVSYIFYDPSGIAFDPVGGNVCFTNAANETFACVLASYGSLFEPNLVTLTTPVALNFTETGLPSGTPWGIRLLPFGPTVNSYHGAVDLVVAANLSYAYEVVVAAPYWATPSSGTIPIADNNVTIPLRFSNAATYPVTFTQSGLPAGEEWYVNISEQAQLSSTNSSVAIALGNGSYSFAFSSRDARYVPIPQSATFQVAGAPVNLTVLFATVLEYAVPFTETGLSAGLAWGVSLNGSLQFTELRSIIFTERNGTYAFSVLGPPGYEASPEQGTIWVNGTSPAAQGIAFSPTPVPLTANFTYAVQSVACGPGAEVSNSVVLSASAAGGVPPYTYAWTLPTGSATTPLTWTTTIYGQNTTATLRVTDSKGASTTSSRLLLMELPPCPPAPPPPAATGGGGPPVETWAIAGLSIALVGATACAVWLALRGRRRGGIVA